ncbi:MAG TPA: M48 family metalloprotease [Acidimicrobiales bacterium]|nr:M48 family metalloprotease [Acidimicrobiales bacterium]
MAVAHENLLPARVGSNRRLAAALCLVPALVALAVGAGVTVSFAGPWAALGVGLGLGALAAALVWAGSVRLALSALGARAAGPSELPRVHNLLEGLCAAAGLSRPAVYVVDDERPNSLSVGRSTSRAAVVVTRGLAARLNRIQLEGVLAHELSHVKAADILPATVAVAALGPLLAVAPFLRAWLQSAAAQRELLADLAAVSLTRYPPGLISALEQISELSGGANGLAPLPGGWATAHLWLAAPGSGDRPGAGGSLAGRIEALSEL